MPHLGTGLARLHKQHVALALGPVGQEQRHGIGLIEAGQVPEVAVLTKGPFAVGMVNRQGCSRNHRCGAAQGLKEAGPTRGEQGRRTTTIDRLVGCHGAKREPAP